MKASIIPDASCADCSWPVIDCCCNDEWGDWDWWQYCSNKGCKNHAGEGVFQDSPPWVKFKQK